MSLVSVFSYIRHNEGYVSNISKAPTEGMPQGVMGRTVSQAEGQRGLGRSTRSSGDVTQESGWGKVPWGTYF